MAVIEQETQLENPLSVLDSLYCEEEDEDLGEYGLELEGSEKCGGWEDDEIVSLLSKEKETVLDQNGLNSDGSLMLARTEAIEWMLRVIARYGFTVMTTMLAVNYFDRFVSSLGFRRDKQWMGQLAAVACLSLAAKVEETQVPLLVDLQVETSKYVFEAKTIQKMELLVLSTLEWKMNPVTPLSFIDLIIMRLELKTQLRREFLQSCERLLLFVITGSRFVWYLPSVLAAATVLHVIKDVEPCYLWNYQNELMEILNLNLSQDKVDGLSELILELSGSHGGVQFQTHKRKYEPLPTSPNGVIDAYFGSDCSNETWIVASSVSSSPEPLSKKRRDHDQNMSLDPVMHMSAGVIGSPH